MNFRFSHPSTNNNAESRYATPREFCLLFTKNADSLYLLAVLLTADAKTAEQCIVAGLRDCEGDSVFRECAESWARRIIIKKAIDLVARHAGSEKTLSDPPGCSSRGLPENVPVTYAPFSNVLALGTLQRFAFVLSNLEGYCDQDCASLLNISRSQFRDAHVRALDCLRALEATGTTRI